VFKPDNIRKWQKRTPAMAAGITDHIWSLKELLTFRIHLTKEIT